MRRECEATVIITATPEAVWAVVSDVTRVGEWSGECRGCEWVEGADRPRPGAHFRGRNRRGGFRWTRLNEVIVANEPHDLVWQTVARAPYPDSVEWHISLEPQGRRTKVRQSFRVLHMPWWMDRAVSLAVSPHRDRTADLVEDLTRLKTLVESAPRHG
jgi:uncharacterized protein YndB with AHSA1/START domain